MADQAAAQWQREKLAKEAKFLARTPSEEIGPMYPVAKPEDRGGDLTRSSDGRQVDGQVLYVRGRVLDLTGEAVTGATVEIWHADPHGRYPHPCDLNPAPLDPAFTGWAQIVTDRKGRYRLRTTKPGAYPTSTPGWWRPPHIHFQVTTEHDRLVTQMYLPGEELNDADELLARHRRLNQDARVIATLLPLEEGMEEGAMNIEFNVVVPTPNSIAAQKRARAAEASK